MDLVPEHFFGCDLVAFCYRNVSHIVSEAGDLTCIAVCPGQCRTSPDIKPLLYMFIHPVAGNHGAVQTQPGAHESEFPAAVG